MAAMAAAAPPLTSPVVYDDDDTLFRLIALGNVKVWFRFAQPFSSKWVMSKQQMDDAKARVTWVN